MRPDRRADDVKYALYLVHPRLNRRGGRFFERFKAGVDFDQICTQKLHPKGIELLARGVGLAHIHVALKPK